MGAELIAPIAKWGAVLVGALVCIWWLGHWVRASSRAEAERDMQKEVLDAMEKSRLARELSRLRSRRERINELSHGLRDPQDPKTAPRE